MSMTTNQEQIEWRRSKVQELVVKGNNHYEIASILKVSRPTITRDIQCLREQAKDNIKKYIDERLPEEYEKCLIGLNVILKEAWNTAEQAEDKRAKIQALSLAKDCYSMKLELLTHSTVVDDAMRFVSQHLSNREKRKNSSNDSNDEDSKEMETTNKVF